MFTSASAVSTTGLVSVNIYDSYNFLGQFIILCLFQIGGIGYMTLTTYYLLMTTSKLSRWHNSIMGAEFAMPNSIRIEDFIKSTIVFTLFMEVSGALALFQVLDIPNANFSERLWFSVFHSVSAFCTAGFSLFSNSFENYTADLHVNVVLSILAIAGSLGFIVITDLWYRITRKSKKLSFTTKIVVTAFLLLLIVGASIFYFAEPLLGNHETPLLASFFQTMSAMTTVGFNSVTISSLSTPIILIIIFLMYIGASPSGTAGGLKITTLTALVSILISRLKGRKEISFCNKKIPFNRLYVATSSFILYTSLIFLFTFLFTLTERADLEVILFEVASALGTVGISMGLTADLSIIGKMMTVLLMFVGRVGVLTFGFALLQKVEADRQNVTKEDLAV